jgi:hypothetical protein
MRPLSHALRGSLSSHLSASLLAVGTATLVIGLAAPATARPAITLTPGDLPRGADVSIPHVDGDGHTIVDGAIRVKVTAPQVSLLGKSGAAYVVGTMSNQGGHGRIYRVTSDGQRTLLAKAQPYQTLLSDDGGTIVTTRVGGTLKSTITAYDATTGAAKATKVFKDYATALDARGDQVLIGSLDKTLLWTTSTSSVGIVSRDGGYIGDLSSDVFSTFTKDPYDGGCTEVRRISTRERLWRSCTEQVAAFNADASRIATIGILSDGPGPGRVDARTIDGKHLGRYQVASGWFGSIGFETQTALLLEVNGARKAFTARCTGTVCERASKLRPAETLRTS